MYYSMKSGNFKADLNFERSVSTNISYDIESLFKYRGSYATLQRGDQHSTLHLQGWWRGGEPHCGAEKEEYTDCSNRRIVCRCRRSQRSGQRQGWRTDRSEQHPEWSCRNCPRWYSDRCCPTAQPDSAQGIPAFEEQTAAFGLQIQRQVRARTGSADDRKRTSVPAILRRESCRGSGYENPPDRTAEMDA